MTKSIKLILIIALSIITLHAYYEYRGDFYIHQAKRHVKNWELAEHLLNVAIHYAPKNAKLLDKAGLMYYKKFKETGDKQYYRKGRRLLNLSNKYNPYDSYNMLHMIGLEVIAGIPDRKYVDQIATILMRFDGNNPTIRKHLGLEK